MKTYSFIIIINYMIEDGEYCGCSTGGGPYYSLVDAIINADRNHREGPGVPEWDGRGPKTIEITFEGKDGVTYYETFRHYGFWSTALLQRALDWFNGVDSTDDWRAL